MTAADLLVRLAVLGPCCSPLPCRGKYRSVSCDHGRLAVSALLLSGLCCLPLPGRHKTAGCLTTTANLLFRHCCVQGHDAMVVSKTTRCLVTAADLLVRHCCFQGLAVCPCLATATTVRCLATAADLLFRHCCVQGLAVCPCRVSPNPLAALRTLPTCCLGIAGFPGHAVCPCHGRYLLFRSFHGLTVAHAWSPPRPLGVLRVLPTCCFGIAAFRALLLPLPGVAKPASCLATTTDLLFGHCCFIFIFLFFLISGHAVCPCHGRCKDHSVSCNRCRLAGSALLLSGPCYLPFAWSPQRPLSVLRPLPTC